VIAKSVQPQAGRQRDRSSSRSKIFLFSTTSTPVLWPTQPPIQWALGTFSPVVKRPGREANHSPPTSAEVKDTWIYTSIPLYVSMGVSTETNFTFTFLYVFGVPIHSLAVRSFKNLGLHHDWCPFVFIVWLLSESVQFRAIANHSLYLPANSCVPSVRCNSLSLHIWPVLGTYLALVYKDWRKSVCSKGNGLDLRSRGARFESQEGHR
jgi:hypothetical protein